MNMSDVYKIYDNQIGISFKWHKDSLLTQIIFKNVGFHLCLEEIELFIDQIQLSRVHKSCLDCKMSDDCKSLLLRTPSSNVSMAVSLKELNDIEDLLNGTMFQLELNDYLKDLCNN